MARSADRRRLGSSFLGVAVGAVLLSGCVTSPADRVTTYELSNGDTCRGEWRLELLDSTAPDALKVARRAVEDADLDRALVARWERRLRAEHEAEFGDPSDEQELRFERLAPLEALREVVRDALAEAGFTDAPARTVEVHATARC